MSNTVGCLLHIVSSAAESWMILSTKCFPAAMHSGQLELVLHGQLMPPSHGKCRKELIYSDTETTTLAFEVPDSWNKIRFREKKKGEIMMMIIIKMVLLLLFGRFSLRIQTTWRKNKQQTDTVRRHCCAATS